MKQLHTSLFALALCVSAMSAGCDDGAIERVNSRLDCREICDRFADCIGGEDDEEDCRETCRERSLENEEGERRLGECSDCVNKDNSCVEDTFKCADECVGFVPVI